METLIIILIISIGYWKIRNSYYNYLDLEFQLDLYRLRDRLRTEAIEGKIKANDWFFDYMDSSICKTIEEVSSLNIFSIILLYLKNRKNERIISFRRKVNESLNKNQDAKKLYAEYGLITLNYIIKKHYIIKIIVYLLHNIIESVSFLSKGVKSAYSMVEGVRSYPETSTVSQYLSRC